MNPNSSPLIRLSNVGMTFDNRQILSDINLSVNRGDCIVITGPNGGGKTTLLRILLRLLKPTEGKVEYFEKLRIGYLPQKNSIDSRFPITVREVIASGLLNSTVPDHRTADAGSAATVSERVVEMLRAVDLAEHADKPISSLSGGQLQRTLLGRALISQPSLLVLDEPLSYIDRKFSATFHSMLKGLVGNTTIVIVTHELTDLLPLATRHISVNHRLTALRP